MTCFCMYAECKRVGRCLASVGGNPYMAQIGNNITIELFAQQRLAEARRVFQPSLNAPLMDMKITKIPAPPDSSPAEGGAK